MNQEKEITHNTKQRLTQIYGWVLRNKLISFSVVLILLILTAGSIYYFYSNDSSVPANSSNDEALLEATAQSLEEASTAEQEDNFSVAIAEYENSLPGLDDKERADVEFKLGELHMLVGNYDESIKYFGDAENSFKGLGSEDDATRAKIQREIAENRKFSEEFSSQEDGP